jgi:hypothetical protein
MDFFTVRRKSKKVFKMRNYHDESHYPYERKTEGRIERAVIPSEKVVGAGTNVCVTSPTGYSYGMDVDV